MRFDGGTKNNVHYASCLRTAVTNGTQSHPADMIETIRGIDPLDKESHRYQQEPNPAAADFDPKQCLSKEGGKIPVFDEIVKVPAAPPASYFGAAPKRRLSESGTTMTTSGSYNHLISLEGSGSGEEGISHAQSADAGVAVAPPAPAGTDSSPPARPVAKRANSLGHLATDGFDSSDISDEPKQTTTTRGLFQKLGLRRHTMQHHRSNSASDVLDVSGRGGDMNTTRPGPTPKPPVPAPAANRKPKAVPARFHHRCTMEDSIHVQLHKQVLDDEEHEENPHLQDYLKPKQFVHMSKRESQDNLLHLETQYLRPKVKPMVVAEEESSDEENENENDDPLSSASAAANVIDADVAAGIAADADADDVSVERTEVHDEPITAVAHKKCDPNEPLRSCMKKAWGQDTEPRKPKRNVIFHEVTVRDYGITLGDHPNVSYGPPITLSWDYLEYDPLDIDEYEIHHPKRRNLRQMGLNYYQRRNLLLLQTDYTEEELRLAWKSVKKAKQQRYITRTYTSAFPVRIVEDACQSAVRKVKRSMSGGGKRSSQ